MLTSIGMVFGTSGKHNLWIAEDEEKIDIPLDLLSINRGDKNGG